jgi:hypothetical protein
MKHVNSHSLKNALAASLTSVALLGTPMNQAALAVVEPTASPAVQASALRKADASKLSAARRAAVKPAATPIRELRAIKPGSRRRKQDGDSVFPTAAQSESSSVVALPPSSTTSDNVAATSDNIAAMVDPRIRGGRIVDTASMLTHDQINKISQELNRIESEVEGSQMLVVTVPDVPSGTSPKQFATALFNNWGIGSKKTQNGVLMLVVKDQRRIEIEVGLALDDKFDKTWCTSMLKAEVVPLFKEGRYGDGVYEGVRKVEARLLGGGQAYEGGSSASSFDVGDAASLAWGLLSVALGVGGEGGDSDGGSSSGNGGGGADW